MSRAAKVFLGTSVAFMAGTIWGVHWLQQRESDVSRAASAANGGRECELV